jgi:hypothetical protein
MGRAANSKEFSHHDYDIAALDIGGC